MVSLKPKSGGIDTRITWLFIVPAALVAVLATYYYGSVEVGTGLTPPPPPPLAMSHRPTVTSGAANKPGVTWLHGMIPPACTAGATDVVLHRPRDNSSIQMSPFDPARQCCTPVRDDIDKGLTMYHLLVRYVCSVHTPPSDPTRSSPVPRVRLLQIGANTGDNDNDHLFRFLKRRLWAEAVLLEPVPWLFEKLQHAYRGLEAEVTPVNAAIAKEDGRLPFFAPLPEAPGWVKQMGGFSVTPRNMNVLRRKKLTHMIRETSVATMSFATVLRQRGWDGQLPHVVVIDTEGFDAHVVDMLLETMKSTPVETGPTGTARIPIIQYEWKHLAPSINEALMANLVGLGYCVLKVHYDVLAYHAATMEARWPPRCTATFSLPS